MASQPSSLRSFSRSTWLFLLATLFDGVMVSARQLFFNFYILSLGHNKDFLGIINAAPWLASLIFSIPMGMLAGRIGYRKAMVIGLVVDVAGLTVQALVNQPVALVTTAFVGGLGYALLSISNMPFMMSVSTSENRALLFSLNAGLITLAGAAGSLFAGQLPAFFAGWLQVPADSAAAYRGVLLFSVVLSLGALLPLLAIREPARIHLTETQHQPVFRVFTRAVVWKVNLPNLLIGIGAGLLIPYLNLFFSEKFLLTDQALGLLFSLSSLVTGISIVVGPRLAFRLKSKIRTTVYSQSASLLFLVIMGFTPLSWLAGISFVLRVAFMNMAYPLYNAFAMEQIEPREQGAASGLFVSTNTLGWTIGPIVSGWIQQRYGFSPLFVITAVLYSAAVLLTRLLFGETEKALETAAQIAQVS